jgi:hypothetical protein
MEFTGIVGDVAMFSYRLTVCKNCGDKMIPSWANIPRNDRAALEQSGIKIEAGYHDSGLCTECLKAGGYKKACKICRMERTFPHEFSFRITEYPQYPEDDIEYHNVCDDCVSNRQKDVIDLLVFTHEGELKDLRSKRNG